MRPKRVQAGAELALNLRLPGCHVHEDKPRGGLSTGPRELQTVETLGLGLARSPPPWAPLRTRGLFPLLQTSCGLPLAGRLLSAWGGDRMVVEGGGREGCQGSHPCRFLQISVRLCSVGNPVTELLFLSTEGGARSPGGVRWQRVQTWKRTASGLGTFGKACGPFTFSISVPSPPHLQVSSSPPLLTLPPPQPSSPLRTRPSLLWPNTVPQPPLLCLRPQPYIWVTRGHSTSSSGFKQPGQTWGHLS